MIDIRSWFYTLHELLVTVHFLLLVFFTCVAYRHKAGRKETNNPTTEVDAWLSGANFPKGCILTSQYINFSMKQSAYLPSTTIHWLCCDFNRNTINGNLCAVLAIDSKLLAATLKLSFIHDLALNVMTWLSILYSSGLFILQYLVSFSVTGSSMVAPNLTNYALRGHYAFLVVLDASGLLSTSWFAQFGDFVHSSLHQPEYAHLNSLNDTSLHSFALLSFL